MGESSMVQFADNAPYPPVQVEGKNRQYARAMLDNFGSRHSEISTITLYVYNSIVTKEEAEEISSCFRGISIVEMHHLSIFGQLACLLGAEPRMWSRAGSIWNFSGKDMRYWNAGFNSYSRELSRLLKNAIDGEHRAIQIYRKQCEWIKDKHIRENLERIIKDEELHVKLLRGMYMKHVQVKRIQ